jgi:hypothetical protein
VTIPRQLGLSLWEQAQLRARNLVLTCASSPLVSRVFNAGIDIPRRSNYSADFFHDASPISSCVVHRVRRFQRDAWTLHRGNQWYNDWRALAVALGISYIDIIVRPPLREGCFSIRLIRKGFRSDYSIEHSQGFLVPIAQNEVLFYALDTLHLFIAISVYSMPFWPGRFIRQELAVESTELERRTGIRSQGQKKA